MGVAGMDRGGGASGGGDLIHPNDGAVFCGRALLFVWDLRDAGAPGLRARLVIKPRHVGQSPEQAFERNPSLVETEVAFVQHLALDVEQLGPVRSEFVWRVTALGEGVTALAASEIRRFACTCDLIDTSWLLPDGMVTKAQASEPPPKPKVAKGGAPAQACPNGDLEMGTLQNWQAYSGSRLGTNTIDLSQMVPGAVAGRHSVMSAGWDGQLGSGVLSRVNEGKYSVRLGDDKAIGSVDMLAYTFIITPQNRYFSFRYALVLQFGQHMPNEQPFFAYYIVKGASPFFNPFNNWPVHARRVIANPIDPFFVKRGPIVYRDWTPTCIDLGQYLGQTMTIAFMAADCYANNGHFGYAYIDALCLSNEAIARFAMPREICAGARLIANGVESSNETSHFWGIEESDANGVPSNPSSGVYEWFVAQKAGPIDLTAWYAAQGKTFKCNTYYRVKLAVTNDCTPWHENVQLLLVRCPTVDAGPDACVGCQPNGKTLVLGTGSATPAVGHSYRWSPAVGLSDATVPRPKHAHGSVAYPITYTLTVTDRRGCTASDSVTLYCRLPLVEIIVKKGCCNHPLTAVASGYSSLVWSTGETTETITVSEAGTYSVTARNACGQTSASVTISAAQGLRGPFSPIKVFTAFGPFALVLHDPTAAPGATPAYNATDYHLMIFARDSNELVWEVTGTNGQCKGLKNGQIQWLGVDKWGTPVPQDQYAWVLRLRNCNRGWAQAGAGNFGVIH